MSPLWVGAGAAVAASADVRRRFTWVDRYDQEYRAYAEGPDGTVLVPRALLPWGKAEDRTSVGLPAKFARANISLREDQAELVARAKAFLDGPSRGGIVEASTGKGKTYMAMELIRHVGRKALVVVPKGDLIRGTDQRPQWWEHLRDVLGVPEERIGVWRGDRVDIVGKDVVVGVLKSMSMVNRYPAEFYAQFGLLIVDECHSAAADLFSHVMFNFPARWRVGLSATPDRKDGRGELLDAHFGLERAVLRGVPMSPKVLRYMVRMPALRKVPHSGTRNGHVLKLLARSFKRNRLIAHLAGECHRRGRNVVVFSHSVQHLEAIAQLLGSEKVKGVDVGFYVGSREDDKGKMRKVAAAKLEVDAHRPIVMASYGAAKEGTNCPWWDACILASPRADVRQPVGRVLRPREGKKQPAVFDLVDVDSHLFGRWAHARHEYYVGDECGAEIIEMDAPEGME